MGYEYLDGRRNYNDVWWWYGFIFFIKGSIFVSCYCIDLEERWVESRCYGCSWEDGEDIEGCGFVCEVGCVWLKDCWV